jgi:putative transposase
MNYPQDWPQFFTATISQWKYLLSEDRFKDIIIEALRNMVIAKRIHLYGFVIMSNHMHLIWQALYGYDLKKLQTSLLKFTARKFLLQLEKEKLLEEFGIDAVDRKHNFWKRDSLGIELFTPAVFQQKLNYCHFNPVRAGLCKVSEEYYYSSALFYEKGIDHFDMLVHYMG